MIVECSSCHARHDVSGFAPGTRARCRCGAELLIPTPAAETGLLRCPQCGGAVAATDPQCGFCHAALLVRSCPRCLAKVFHGHRHCPHCGAATDVAATVPAAEERPCPRCETPLVARLLGDLALDDCPSCAGVFIDGEAIERLLGDRQAARAEAVLGTYRGTPRAVDTTPRGGRLYIMCPVCRVVMNRRQFARGSGVVIDVCRKHGTWFDGGELPAVVEFVMNGGLEKAEKAELADQREAVRRARADVAAAQAQAAMRGDARSSDRGGGALLDLLFSLWR
ncbi:MAG: zf-TFIIB domain-containing protein [Kofleriaceae bacterium]|nr:zf-TFIIB domain-containing protein [Kofleriaceae bacterium]